jgi:ADP-ribosylglycohydrolase
MIKSQSLLALACGDSYGSHFEMAGLMGTTFDIKSLPEIPVIKRVTDDTKMAVILLEHYKNHKKIRPNILIDSYREWAIKDGQTDGIGMHTYKVLVKKSTYKDSQGNGALMRVIPFGVELIKDGYSFEDAVRLMNQDSALTHKNETIFMANRLSLDIAINGIEVIEKPIYEDILSKLKIGDTAWVIHSLYLVLETLKQNLSFTEGFKYIVSYGGDTDTNCAIYGAIRGFKENISKEVALVDFLPSSFITTKI